MKKEKIRKITTDIMRLKNAILVIDYIIKTKIPFSSYFSAYLGIGPVAWGNDVMEAFEKKDQIEMWKIVKGIANDRLNKKEVELFNGGVKNV